VSAARKTALNFAGHLGVELLCCFQQVLNEVAEDGRQQSVYKNA
jgi:hypothetical protein